MYKSYLNKLSTNLSPVCETRPKRQKYYGSTDQNSIFTVDALLKRKNEEVYIGMTSNISVVMLLQLNYAYCRIAGTYYASPQFVLYFL